MRLIRYEQNPTCSTGCDLDSAVSARLGSVFEALLGGVSGASSPTTYFDETAENYSVKVELPGVKKEDVRVEVKDDLVTVTAKRAVAGKEGETTEFRRVFGTPDGVDASKIQAAYDNGLLLLTLPKAEETKPRQVEVK